MSIRENPGFWPNPELLFAQATIVVQKLRLTHLLYFEDNDDLEALTFIFSDGARSPPPETYSEEPDCVEELPDRIGRLEFHNHLKMSMFTLLSSLCVYD